MNTADTIALASTIGTGIAALIAVPSVIYARRAAKASEKSADAGDDSAAAAKDSAESARRSADEAAKITAIETERRVEERQRWHEEFRPEPPAEIIAESRKSTPTDTLFGLITVPRGYRVKADAHFHTGGWTNLGLSSMLHANRQYDFQIEQWPPQQKDPVTKEIRFRFWPPREGDGMDVWTCGCGRPSDESADSPGHWEWTVPVVRTRPGRSISM